MTEKSSVSVAGTPPRILIAAIEKLLRPLVKLMLSYQITYPVLSTMLKKLYVDVAAKDFSVDGKRPSDSRVNLLSGVHRKDVKRLREPGSSQENALSQAPISAQIIAYWTGSGKLTDEQGRPKPLPLKKQHNNELDFEELVSGFLKQDIRPRVILDEWLRLGVARVENDMVILNTGAFTPEKGFDEKVFFFGKNLQDHISAGTHNLLGYKPSYFDRSVYYDGLSTDSVTMLAALADELGMKALNEMNRQALALQQQDKTDDNTANYRINFGVFNFNSANIPATDTDGNNDP